MIRLIIGAICLLTFCLSATAPNALERARHKYAAIETLHSQKVEVSPCYRKRRKYGACSPSTGSTSKKRGFADISVIDENKDVIKGFCVRVNGKTIGEAPLAAFPLDAGKNVIEVQHEKVGEACQEATIKSGDVAKLAFQFIRLREKVTQLTTKVVAREHHGEIVVINGLENTEVFVDTRKEVEDSLEGRVLGLPDSRVSKGKGSLKISNLVPDYYVVEFRLPTKEDGKPESAKPPVCGGTQCIARVHLNSCDTVRIEARPDGLTKTVSTGCKKKSTARTRAKKRRKKRTMRAHRHW